MLCRYISRSAPDVTDCSVVRRPSISRSRFDLRLRVHVESDRQQSFLPNSLSNCRLVRDGVPPMDFDSAYTTDALTVSTKLWSPTDWLATDSSIGAYVDHIRYAVPVSTHSQTLRPVTLDVDVEHLDCAVVSEIQARASELPTISKILKNNLSSVTPIRYRLEPDVRIHCDGRFVHSKSSESWLESTRLVSAQIELRTTAWRTSHVVLCESDSGQ